ncbi:DUF2185 domain-containing protein [Planobispora siamensis]|uniref:Immunity protein Imm33 domain-containing protein n=1 Tax=Planobispora siamensis TaxID=936338 RepID=A0A8J3WR27_9ACTN|nr:DUF2185 domain-containing protein [Planobispora siamensis]GIH97637.1 hypothetical protein Psi01_82670 [Planobispora siamensis]
MTELVTLGQIDVPSGILLILDPGLARFWRHDGDPRSPRPRDGEDVDLAIAGPDAVAAGRAYNRQFDPRYLFDVAVDRAEAMGGHFAAFAAERGFDAHARRLEERVPHTRRARLAVEAGGGAGVVVYNRLWAVAVGGLPADRPLPVVAEAMEGGEFPGRWRSIDVIVDPDAETVDSHAVQGVMVDHGQLMCADLGALGEFRMWESLDGRADFVFWGADAAELAARVGATRLTDREFGWTDVIEEEIGAHAERVQEAARREGLKIGVDFRPHDNLERLNAQIRANDTRAGTLSLAGARACGFDNRWGDGVFTIVRDLDAQGRLVRIRLDVGNEETQRRMRRVRLMGCEAIVSNLVLDGGHPPRFIERMEPIGPDDSGWGLLSGAESEEFMADGTNFGIVGVRDLVTRYPAFEEVLDAPIGSLFRLREEVYVPD